MQTVSAERHRWLIQMYRSTVKQLAIARVCGLNDRPFRRQTGISAHSGWEALTMATFTMAMKRCNSWRRRIQGRAIVTLVALLAVGWASSYAPRAQSGRDRDKERDEARREGHDQDRHDEDRVETRIENNHEFRNPGGRAATFSTQGFVDLTGDYFKAQGTNGRSCASCHVPEDAWSINPGTLQQLFDDTDGTAPIFNLLDANNPLTADVLTVAGRRAAYSMLLTRGVFRRGGALKEPREWDLTAVDDPHGFAAIATLTTPARLVHWRRGGRRLISQSAAPPSTGTAAIPWGPTHTPGS
jgi:hypothetical protein